MNRKHAVALASLIAPVLLAGCATIYRTPGAESVPLTKLAVLKYNGGAASGYTVSKVDGRHRGIGVFSRFELTPGEHSIQVEVTRPFTYSRPIILNFESVPQRIYELKHESTQTGPSTSLCTTWIVDTETGQKVSRQAPETPS